ncbi:Uncharacterised protein [Mycobacteroides abscessus]|nr:Uncharacterised protein [Mycobacteroides abscessus]
MARPAAALTACSTLSAPLMLRTFASGSFTTTSP